MADGKWIEGLTPDTPAADAAGAVLRVRLAAVRDRLPAAILGPERDAEHVHQVRVATRRAGAALGIFRPLLSKKHRRKTRDALRTIRRAAGAARDWDVFLAALPGFASLDGQPAALHLLTGYAVGQRIRAQDQLAALQPFLDGRWSDEAALVPERPTGRKASAPVSKLARTVLADLFDELNRRIEDAPTATADLHQLRITGKRVRYAMEVFAELFAPPFREVIYPAVERVQETLGAVQDCHVAEERINALADAVRRAHPRVAEEALPGLSALLDELRARAEGETRAFAEWTEHWREITRTHPLESLRVG